MIADNGYKFAYFYDTQGNYSLDFDYEEDFQKIKFTFERLTSEFDSTSPMSKTMTELLFNQLLIYIYRHIKLDFPHYDSISFSTILISILTVSSIAVNTLFKNSLAISSTD